MACNRPRYHKIKKHLFDNSDSKILHWLLITSIWTVSFSLSCSQSCFKLSLSCWQSYPFLLESLSIRNLSVIISRGGDGSKRGWGALWNIYWIVGGLQNIFWPERGVHANQNFLRMQRGGGRKNWWRLSQTNAPLSVKNDSSLRVPWSAIGMVYRKAKMPDWLIYWFFF